LSKYWAHHYGEQQVESHIAQGTPKGRRGWQQATIADGRVLYARAFRN
jgi:hypothetical protein